MIGSVSPAMHKYIWVPAAWVIKHKFLRFFSNKKYNMYELPIVRDFRDGKVTKAELDSLSTCDINAVVNDGLSENPKSACRHKRRGNRGCRYSKSARCKMIWQI